ncbi:hypothetical protein MYRNA_65 [Mycobacterium phage Myrna]|uniref:Uncharacterized protein n=1 Tax=Mycobacterium phage Myrna TaxID=546805 RepID=B5LJ76_9CAUD|nr:gp65 [Mycobacterium phage Myrna]ACH62073.1 hypothetical protein MYRNA_65 [Mycobacterium phage Myrna]
MAVSAHEPWDYETWVKAWGGNKQWIVGGINDSFPLPEPPGDCEWMLTRELTGEHPTYRLAMTTNDYAFGGTTLTVLRHGLIDKKMYGEAGVRQLAEQFKEWYARRSPADQAWRPDPSQREGRRTPGPEAGGTQGEGQGAAPAEPG